MKKYLITLLFMLAPTLAFGAAGQGISTLTAIGEAVVDADLLEMTNTSGGDSDDGSSVKVTASELRTYTGVPSVTEATAERVLTTVEVSGGVVLVSFAGEVRLPDLCDSATGANVMIVQEDPSETVEIAVTDTSDHLWLDGVDLGANYEIDSPGDAVEDNYIVLICKAANNWHSLGRAGTWVTGSTAD